jgi:hypothetical protein
MDKRLSCPQFRRIRRRDLAAGKYISKGLTPYGYLYNKETKTLEPHPEEAGVAKQLFEWVASGNSACTRQRNALMPWACTPRRVKPGARYRCRLYSRTPLTTEKLDTTVEDGDHRAHQNQDGEA